MEDKIIELENVSMKFRMSEEPINSLKEIFTKSLKGNLRYKEFKAINDVSFSLNKGDTLGLIGKNGAGKSTMLKMIAGILKPTSGKITVKGNVVPMLELGAGFDNELTGRENIFLNGAVLGFSKEYLQAKYDEIVAFAEIGDFIDTPIRSYSSGMMARLAFSIASMVDPEILIVDEILSVGDSQFQKKSFERMRELMSGGATVLFVSHDVKKIKQMCSKALWLDHGQMKMLADSKSVVDEYLKSQES